MLPLIELYILRSIFVCSIYIMSSVNNGIFNMCLTSFLNVFLNNVLIILSISITEILVIFVKCLTVLRLLI